MCFLSRPDPRYQESFIEGAAEFCAEGRLDSTYAEFLGYNLRRLRRYFDEFIRDLSALARQDSLPGCVYPDHVLWLIAGGEYMGQASIRPQLGTRYLVTYGGHVGYSIRPGRRRLGYGKKILTLALDEARRLELDRILITCDEDNIASKKIIESNGGQFERALPMEGDVLRAEGRPGPCIRKLRYWIELASHSSAPPQTPH